MSESSSGNVNGPDFSDVNTHARVRELFERGELEKLWLLPADMGGQDVPANIVYVPVGVGELKAQTDHNVIMPLAAEGKVSRYVAQPRYFGDSFVPSAIVITATEPSSFTYELKIWGDALEGQ